MRDYTETLYNKLANDTESTHPGIQTSRHCEVRAPRFFVTLCVPSFQRNYYTMASKSIESITTIKELQSEPVPNSPRKISKKLTCAVLNKSPLKPARTGSSMFSLNLSDESPDSSMRAVCFQEELFSRFDVNKSYAIESFKLKKSYGKSNFAEVLIDHDTKITSGSDVTQLKIEEKVFNIALRGEAKNQKFFKLKAKVMSIYEAHQVGLYPNNKLRRSISLADSTGHIELVLWRERAETITFVEGDVLSLENVIVSTFNNQPTLTTTFESVISKIDDQITVAVRNVKRRLAQSTNVVSLTTYILAVKEFQYTYSCVNCRKGISPDALKGSASVTCPTCSTFHNVFERTCNFK